jgi:CRP-like cAMP-binding protein
MSREEDVDRMLSALQQIHIPSILLSKGLVLAAQQRKIYKTVTLLHEGGSQQVLWFILDGFAREYHTESDNGREHTHWFWQAGDFVFHAGFLEHKKSGVSIDFYRDSRLLEIDLDMVSGKQLYNEVQQLSYRFAEFSSKRRQEHLMDLLSLNRSAHVKKFFSGHQFLFNFVRHRDLASFLGIRDKSLYRYLKSL